MCRFLAYKGPELFMSDLLIRSEQSLIRQSFGAREREEPLNGDGFGVGWYAHEVDPTPCVFTSVQPAWANRNLHRLSEKIRSSCFFAHVRAASAGSPVSELNCHPFQYNKLLWMHNGRIAGFDRIRRPLRESLSDEFYNFIQGTTDSEHAFALFLNEVGEGVEDFDSEKFREALRKTIEKIEDWQYQAGIAGRSYLNFSVTDGRGIIASRYVTDPGLPAQTLYVARGRRFELRDGRYRMVAGAGRTRAVIVASEPLTDDRQEWESVPINHLVSVSADFRVNIQPV